MTITADEYWLGWDTARPRVVRDCHSSCPHRCDNAVPKRGQENPKRDGTSVVFGCSGFLCLASPIHISGQEKTAELAPDTTPNNCDQLFEKENER
jgi:hypothetical protein